MTKIDLSQEWLSQSRIADMRCMYKYKLVHIDKLVRRWTPAPMKRGTLVHAGLQFALWWAHCDAESRVRFDPPVPQGITAEQWGEAAIRNAQAMWLQSEAIAPHLNDDLREGAARQVDQAIAIFRRVWAFLDIGRKWKTVCLPDGTPLIEYKMRAPGLLPGGWAGVQGTLDWVAQDLETGHVWLFDLKTTKAVQSPEYFSVQTQAPLYQYLLARDGLKLSGTATLQARAAIPSVPTVNKTKQKGQDRPGMSRAKIATDPDTYRKALFDNGFDPCDYADVIAELKPFDSIAKEFRSFDHVATLTGDVQQAAQLLSLAHAYGLFPRSAVPFTCAGCTHKSYCLADLNGEDTEWLAQTEYMRESEIPYPAFEMDEDGED